jgi:hypothetical protein
MNTTKKWDEELVERAKTAAQQVVREAQSALAHGQQALDEWQVRRDASRLLADLGAAYYGEQRSGGEPGAVQAALERLDDHVQRYGWVGFPPSTMPAGEPPAAVHTVERVVEPTAETAEPAAEPAAEEHPPEG